MKLFIFLAISAFGSIGVLCQYGHYGGGSDDNLGGGGYFSKGSIVGLSRGIEIHRGHHSGGDGGGDEGGLGGHYGLGGYRAGGLNDGIGGDHDGGDHYDGSSGGHYDGRGHYTIGFGGSDFKTPVDIHHEEVIHLKAHPEYHYDYHVANQKTKDYKSQHEVRDGYKVKGSYSLLEPDHKTIRVVDYTSDKKQGFIAKVSYKKHH